MAGTLNVLDPTGLADGTTLTIGNIPAASITLGTGSTATALVDTNTPAVTWYRINVTSTTQVGQFRKYLAEISKTQSVRARLRVAGPATFSAGRVLYCARSGTAVGASTANAYRLAVTTTRQLQIQLGASPFTAIATTSISGGLLAGTDYEFTVDCVVGTTTSNGAIQLRVCAAGTDTPLTGGTATSTTANLLTNPITGYDWGSNDNSAALLDERITYIQTQPDRALTGSYPTQLPVYTPVTAPVMPTGNCDVVCGMIQSNMRGRADDFNPATDTYPAGVYYWNPTTNAVVRIDTEPAGTLGTFEQVPYMGPMNTFAAAYVAAGQLTAGRSLLLVNLAEGGTGVTLPDSNGGNETWWPSETATKTDLYARATSEMTAVWAAIGTGSKVVASLANHGSTDGSNNTPKATFKARCQEVITSWQAFLLAQGMTTDPKSPYVMMQMRPSLIAGETRHKIIDDAQQELANELPGVEYAFSPVGTTYERADTVHFNAAGVRIIGSNLYTAFVGPPDGISTVSVDWSATASGTSTRSGSGSEAHTYVGSASGSTQPGGSGSESHSYTGSAAGSTSKSGSATESHAYTGAASGSSARSGNSTGTIDYSGSALGSVGASGSASSAYQVVGAATGGTTYAGSGAVNLAYTGTAQGSALLSGSAAEAHTYTGSASGSTSKSGAATEAHTYTGSAVGTAPVVGANQGSASVAVAYSGTATGSTTASGSGSEAHAYTGTATGSTVRSGQAAEAHVYTGSASGSRSSSGTASTTADYSGSASGTAPVVGANQGSAVATWNVATTATGSKQPVGTATGTVTVVGSASGSAANQGSGTATYVFTAAASGTAPSVAGKFGSAVEAHGWSAVASGLTKTSGSATLAVGWRLQVQGEIRGTIDVTLRLPRPRIVVKLHRAEV